MTHAGAPLGTRAVHPDGPRGTRIGAHLVLELRGFADIIQSEAAANAAAALLRFTGHVADAAAHFPNAELRAEGDSAYLTFPDAADAVTCALGIVSGFGNRSGSPGVAGGISTDSGAGTSDGFVEASSVSAAATPGEVLLTDQARRLAGRTPGVVFRRAIPRWSRTRSERASLWVAMPVTATTGRAARTPMRAAAVLAAVSVAVLVITAAVAWPRAQPAAAPLAGEVTIGAQLPLSGEAAPFGMSLENAITLAIEDAAAQAGGSGPKVNLRALDGGVQKDQELAVATMDDLVGDSSVIAVVGPAWSDTAVQDIPIGNRAGLLQCSPSTTRPNLTKPRFGGLDLRSADPDRISFVRVITTDDMQGPAAASLVFAPPTPGSAKLGIPATHGLGVHHALVIDDTTSYGRDVADAFQSAFEAMGGVVDRRAHNPGADDLSSTMALLDAALDPAGAVYFGGDAVSALEVKTAMAAAGHAATPLVSTDALYDGPGVEQGSFIQQAGPLAANTYITQVGIAPVNADFQERYRRDFGSAPSDYAAASYACTQLILAGLRDAIAHGADAAGLREAVRAAVVGAPLGTPTVIGDVGFDANGDSLDQYVTFYTVDPTAAEGKGDWVLLDQQNFGPAR
jgi:branched-chain amino acid transport system substrate-binding protein